MPKAAYKLTRRDPRKLDAREAAMIADLLEMGYTYDLIADFMDLSKEKVLHGVVLYLERHSFRRTFEKKPPGSVRTERPRAG